MKSIIRKIRQSKAGKYITYRLELLRLRRAAREADRRHKLTGRRYWVMKLQGKYRVYSNREIKELKRMKVFRKDLDLVKLNDVCVYKTK